VENEKLPPGGKFEPPIGIAKGSGRPGDKSDPDPAKTPEKADPKKDCKKDKACKKQKRNPKGKGTFFLSCPHRIFSLSVTATNTSTMMIPLPPQSSTKMKVNIRAISSHLSAFWQTLKHISKERDVCIHGYIYISNASGPPSMSKIKADPGSHNSLRPYLRPSEFRAMP